MPEPPDSPVGSQDEGRHPPDPRDALWNESWYFDFAAPDGSFGGYVRVGLTPNIGPSGGPSGGTANFWACAVGTGRPLVIFVEHAAPHPASGDGLSLAGDGFEVEQQVVAPFKEFTVRYRADARSHADPRSVYAGAAGDPMVLVADLSWRSASAPYPYPGMTRYELPCEVSGVVTVGDEVVAVTGQGERDHSWGHRDWWSLGWCWTSGRLDDGTWFHGMRPAPEALAFEPGFLRRPDSAELVPASRVTPRYGWGEDSFPTRTSLSLHDLDFDVTPLFYAPVVLTAPDGRVSQFARALCRYDEVQGAGRTGFGWTEWNLPPGGRATPRRAT